MTKKTLAYTFVLATLFIWGTSFLATKILLVQFSAIEIILLRYSIAFIALLIGYPHLLGWTSWKHEAWFFLAGITGTSIYSFLENTALIHTSASNVSIIVTTSVFFSGVIAQFFFPSEKVTPYFYYGFFVAIIGIALISLNGKINFELSPLGDVLAVLAAVSWGVYSTVVRHMKVLPYHPVQITRRIMMYGVISFLPIYFILTPNWDMSRFMNLEVPILLILLGVFSSAFTLFAWNFAVHTLGVVKTSVSLYLVPVITVVAAFLLIDEQVTWMSGIGTFITLIGLYISMQKPRGELVVEESIINDPH